MTPSRLMLTARASTLRVSLIASAASAALAPPHRAVASIAAFRYFFIVRSVVGRGLQRGFFSGGQALGADRHHLHLGGIGLGDDCRRWCRDACSRYCCRGEGGS